MNMELLSTSEFVLRAHDLTDIETYLTAEVGDARRQAAHLPFVSVLAHLADLPSSSELVDISEWRVGLVTPRGVVEFKKRVGDVTQPVVEFARLREHDLVTLRSAFDAPDGAPVFHSDE